MFVICIKPSHTVALDFGKAIMITIITILGSGSAMTKSADILNFITKASTETVPTLPGINNSGSPELG